MANDIVLRDTWRSVVEVLRGALIAQRIPAPITFARHQPFPELSTACEQPPATEDARSHAPGLQYWRTAAAYR